MIVVNRISLIVCLLALGASVLSGCGRHECEAGQTRTCYSGPQGTANVGLCRDGVQVCNDGTWSSECAGETVPGPEVCDGADNDCNGQVDNGVQNACGGCQPLAGAPGTGCDNCGTWTCDHNEAVKCVPPDPAPGSSCLTGDECPGKVLCQADGTTACKGSRKNQCGVCGGPSLPSVGDTCTGEGGCEGVVTCSGGFGDATYCKSDLPNNCGICGAPDVVGVGGACPGANGCPGVLKCNADGSGTVCEAPAKNSCGLCGGPLVEGTVGQTCGGTGVCAGTLQCNQEKTALVCSLPGGGACTGTNGCAGVMACNAAGDALECKAPEKNACELCGGPTVTGVGDPCTTSAGCAGVFACSADKKSAVCQVTQSCGPVVDHVVISEIAGAGPRSAQDEFVELFNPTAADIDLSGYTLWYRSASAGSTTTYSALATVPNNKKIRAHGYFLIAKTTCTTTSCYSGPTEDLAYSASIEIAGSTSSGGQLFLTNTNSKPTSYTDAKIVDMVGYGSASVHEGAHAAPTQPSSSGSIERKAFDTSTSATMDAGGSDATAGNGSDTNQNGDDFVQRATRDPQNSASPTEP